MKKTIASMLLLGAGLMCRPVYADHPCCGITIDPAPADTNVQCVADIPGASDSDVGAWDNCSNSLAVVLSAVTNGTCPMTITRTWTATDDDCDPPDDTDFVTQTVTVHDTNEPVVTAPAATNEQCLADVQPPPATVPANDNCDGAITASYVGETNSGICPTLITRTWQAVDSCNNTGTATQVITVHDTNAPVVTAPAATNEQCLANVQPPPATVPANDNCDGAITAYYVGQTNSGTCPTIITRTWQAVDSCNNTGTASQTITVMDNIPPDIECPEDTTVEADENGEGYLEDYTGGAITHDNCDLNIEVEQSPTNGAGPYDIGDVIPVTLTAKDDCGKSNSCTFNVKIVCGASCSAGAGSSCSGPANQSVYLDLNLGRMAGGRSAGKLTLHSKLPSSDLGTPRALRFYHRPNGPEVIRTTSWVLRQIRSSEALADIVVLDDYRYEIRFYTDAHAGTKNGQGLYEPTGIPFVIWRFAADSNNVNRLDVSEIRGSTTKEYAYVYNSGQNGWSLSSGGGLKVESRFSEWNSNLTARTESHVIADGNENVAWREDTVFKTVPWGEAKIQTIVDPTGEAEITTRTYFEDPQQAGKYRRLASEQRSDGFTATYDYDTQGRMTIETRGWKDIPAGSNGAVVVSNSYVPVDPSDDGSVWPHKPRTVTTESEGVIASRTYYAYFASANGEITIIEEKCASPTAAYGAAGNLRTVTVRYPDSARNGSYRFDNNSQNITATDSGLPSGDAPRTLAAWMKLDTTYPDGCAGFLSYGTDSYNQKAGLGFDWRDSRNRYDFSQHGGVFLSDHQIGAPGTWVHVAYTYGGNGSHHFYIDGVPSDGMSELGEDPLETVLSGLLRLGGHPGSTGPDGAYLDEVRIYDRALSAGEVETMYRAAGGHSGHIPEEAPTNGLVLYYTFDEDLGQIVQDASGDGRTGQVNGAVWVADSALPWAGRIKSIQYPDGRLDRMVYESGYYDENGGEPGDFTPGTGEDVRVTIIHGTVLTPDGIADKTTREVSIRNKVGYELLHETYVYRPAGDELMDWSVNTYDELGHLTASYFANGTSKSSDWGTGCCGKESDTAADGTVMAYGYDALGRLTSRTKEGMVATGSWPAQPDIVTSYVLDAVGRTLLETTSAGSLALARSNQYDLAGRLIKSVDAAGLETLYSYVDDGRRIETIIRPGGATEITEKYLDGRIKSVTGTGVVPRFFDYGVNADGSQWTLIHTGSEDSPLWEKTTTDMLGRTVSVEKPGFGDTLLTTTYEYNDLGQLNATRRWQGDPPASLTQPPTLYEYDELGRIFRTALDVDDDGAISLDTPDRINESSAQYVYTGGRWWETVVSRIYAGEGDDTPTTVNTQWRKISGSGCGCSARVGKTVDAYGNPTTTTEAFDPENKTTTIEQDVPYSDTDAVSVTVNGLLQSRTTPTGLTTTYSYDALGRDTETTDPRTGASTIHYNTAGQVDYTEDAAGNRTTYAYDSATGRRIAVTDALSNTVYTAYDLQGRVTNVWGATYPVAYEYDSYDRMTAMKTWRDTNGAPDVTRWNYDEATGLLTNKVYADGTGPSYEYDAAGRLTKRTWARGVETAYAYDFLGQLMNIDYSDSTPDVVFTYDRLGRQKTIIDALGTRTNVYNDLALLEEQRPDGEVLTRSYDSLGRPSGLSLDNGYSLSYAYSEVGRFSSITSAMLTAITTVNYVYLPDSDLLSGWTIQDGTGTNQVVTVTKTYEPHRDLVSSVVNTGAMFLISSYEYENDAIGRRTQRQDWTYNGVTSTNVFGYNSRSELADAAMGTNQFNYQYDAIGNRESSVFNVLTNQYQANSLNQYAEVFEGGTLVAPLYDPDGNLTNQGVLSFVWDAENRLVEVRSNGTLRVKSDYDFMGRRVQKIAGSTTNRFVYDGWNLIQEQRNNTLYSYVWGLDLSGSLQGAGGVGGLAARIQHTISGTSTNLNYGVYYASDANGNVTGFIYWYRQGACYQFKYDPYGNVLSSMPPTLRDHKFRFSTKYFDDEPDLCYYGYRFYSPELGRWLSRDGILEVGGFNIYTFINNNAIDTIDVIGNKAFVDKDGPTYLSDQDYDVWAVKQGGSKNNDGKTMPIIVDLGTYQWEAFPCINKGGGRQLWATDTHGYYELRVRKSRQNIPARSGRSAMDHEIQHYENAKNRLVNWDKALWSFVGPCYCAPCDGIIDEFLNAYSDYILYRYYEQDNQLDCDDYPLNDPIRTTSCNLAVQWGRLADKKENVIKNIAQKFRDKCSNRGCQ